MGTTAPDHYLICDGSVYNINDYVLLANFIKTQFGSYNKFGGNGTTTFAVPDLRGEFLRGTGTNGHENQGNGSDVGVHQDGTSIPQLYKAEGSWFRISGNQHAENYDNVLAKNYGIMQIVNSSNYSNLNDEVSMGIKYGDIVSRPTNTSVLYCIKYEPTYIDFSALTAEQINELKLISNVYSTDEHIIGTWIDGKALYRKVILTKTPNVARKTISIYTFPSDVENVINLNYQIVSGNSISPLPYFTINASTGMVGGGMQVYGDDKNIVCVLGDTYWSNLDVRIIAEYTKK